MRILSRQLRGSFGKFLNLIFYRKIPKKIYNFLSFNGFFEFNLDNKKIFFLNSRNAIANDIFYSGIFGNYEGKTLYLWYKFSKILDGCFLDIGAYSGIFSLVAGAGNQNAEIYAYEPHPNNFQLLSTNVEKNNFDNIYINNYGLLDKDGELEFYNDGDNPSGFSYVKHKNIDNNTLTSKCTVMSIKKLLQNDFAHKKVSLVKLDAERAEIIIIRDAIERLAEDKAIIFCEILGEDIDANIYVDFGNLFKKYGYICHNIDDTNNRVVCVENIGMIKCNPVGRNWIFIPQNLEKIKEIKNLLNN